MINEKIEKYTKLIKTIKQEKRDAEELRIVYIQRGKAFFEQQKYRKAIKDFTKALNINNKAEQVYFFRARAYTRNHEYEKALSDYDTVISLRPAYSTPYLNKGLIYIWFNQNPEALPLLTKAIKLEPERAVKAYLARAEVYASNNEYEKAIQDYNSVLELDCCVAEAYLKRYQMRLLQNVDNLTLETDFNIALSLDSGVNDIQNGTSNN